jgi:hypothetical protein
MEMLRLREALLSGDHERLGDRRKRQILRDIAEA